MNNELLLLIEKHTDTLIKQTKTKPQETVEFKMIRSKKTFLFSPPLNLIAEGKWLIGVKLFDCTNSVFNITNKNNSFSITIPGQWNSESAEKTIDEYNRLLEVRSQNDINLHVEQVRKEGLILINDYSSSSLDTFRGEILEELKNAKYNDVEDMVYRFQTTCGEIIDIFDLNYIPTKIIGYSLKSDICQISDINNTPNIFYPIM